MIDQNKTKKIALELDIPVELVNIAVYGRGAKTNDEIMEVVKEFEDMIKSGAGHKLKNVKLEVIRPLNRKQRRASVKKKRLFVAK